jgi:hypothetical protein
LTLAGEKFFDGLVEKLGIHGVLRGIAGAMASDRRHRAQFGQRHARDLAAAVLDREVKIGFAGHDQSVGGDRGEPLAEIARVQFVGADVGVLPGGTSEFWRLTRGEATARPPCVGPVG